MLHEPLRIAVSAGALMPPVTTLLIKQRVQEPETPVRLVETTVAEQLAGVEDGRYCLGLTLARCEPQRRVKVLPLWEDVLAVAVPSRSPLLAFSEIPPIQAAQYPVVLVWPEDHAVVGQQVESLLAQPKAIRPALERVQSFEMMALLVAAGYGIGFGAMSRIAALRPLGIIMRPLATEPIPVRTHLVCRQQEPSAAIHRLIGRARADHAALIGA